MGLLVMPCKKTMAGRAATPCSNSTAWHSELISGSAVSRAFRRRTSSTLSAKFVGDSRIGPDQGYIADGQFRVRVPGGERQLAARCHRVIWPLTSLGDTGPHEYSNKYAISAATGGHPGGGRRVASPLGRVAGACCFPR